MADLPARSQPPTPPARVRLLVTAVTLAATAVAGASLRGGVEGSGETAVVALLLTTMVGVAHLYPLHIGPKLQVSADTAPAFAAALLLPLPWAMLVSAAGIAGGEAWRRTAAIQLAYNTAVATLRAAAAAAVFGVLTAASLADLPSVTEAMPAVAAAALAMYVTNTGLIDLVVAVQRGVSPLAGWWGRHRGRMGHEALLYLTGVLLALIGSAWPPALLLLAVPSVAIYRALRESVAVRQQGRDALADLADVLDERLPYTAGHSRRVAELARILALRAGMSAADADDVYQAARVHNIGLTSVRTSVLQKPGVLSEADWRQIRGHPAVGARLLSRFPEFTADPDLVLSHHERWDGRGYPRGLRGEAIPRGARVLTLIDALVAMRTRRPYRILLSPDAVRAELVEGRGTQFDPTLVDLLLGLFDRSPEFDFDGVLLFGDTGRGERPAGAQIGRAAPRGSMLNAEP